MSSRPSIRGSRSTDVAESRRARVRAATGAANQGGFSLMETLVALLLTGIAMAVFVRDFGFTVQTRREMDLVAETQQALHASHLFLTQELRQAGACLPDNGEFIALAGVDGGTVDELTLRVGIADRADLSCLATLLTADKAAGERTLEVQDATDFAAGQWIYVTRVGGRGGTFRVAAAAEGVIELETGLDADYVAGGGVYAIEERVYAVRTIGEVPVLTVAVDGGEPQPLVAGVEVLDVRYRLDPCPPCDAVALPDSATEWRRVREVELRVVARSVMPKPRGGGFVRVEGATTVRPRNLI